MRGHFFICLSILGSVVFGIGYIAIPMGRIFSSGQKRTHELRTRQELGPYFLSESYINLKTRFGPLNRPGERDPDTAFRMTLPDLHAPQRFRIESNAVFRGLCLKNIPEKAQEFRELFWRFVEKDQDPWLHGNVRCSRLKRAWRLLPRKCLCEARHSVDT